MAYLIGCWMLDTGSSSIKKPESIITLTSKNVIPGRNKICNLNIINLE